MRTIKGIDVSEFQGNIDWKKVSASGVQFAILRSVKSNGKVDSKFVDNLNGCTQNGLPVSVYKYTYATTVASAKKEAEAVVKLLKDNGLVCTVWWDVEDASLKKISRTALNNAIKAAQSVIEAAGLSFGIYTGLNVYKEHWFDFDLFDVPYWVARYPVSGAHFLSYTPAEMYKPNIGRDLTGWQYTSEGVIDGINGRCDLDLWYADIEENGIIYTVSVGDCWTRAEAEAHQAMLENAGIKAVVHKVKLLDS